MNKFSGAPFVRIASLLGANITHTHTGSHFKGDPAQMEDWLNELGIACNTIGLEQSARQAFDLLLDEGPTFGPGHPRIQSKFETRLEMLLATIQSEMGSELFIWIPPRHAKCYTQEKLFFGALVSNKFPSASLDIAEAGKCFALGRHTAAVMHCMRVLEHGLRALCLRLEIPFGETSWKSSINKIEKRLIILDSQVKQKTSWRKKRQFYQEAAAEFSHFKDAWRNHAAHGHEHYSEQRAEKIIGHTRNFMLVLASQLKERRQPKARIQ